MVIEGDLKGDNISVQDFVSGSDTASGEYTIDSTPLPIYKLAGATFKVKVSINKLDIYGIILEKVSLVAKNLKNVVTVKLDPAAKFANGTLDFNLTYDLNLKNPVLTLTTNTNNVKLESLLDAIYGKSPINGSEFKLTANMSGSGNNLKSIVGSLNGKILATAGPGTFLNSNAALGNFFSNVLMSLISFDKTKPSTSFTCGVLNFKVNDGVANAKNAIGVEAASVNILGNGMIDLSNGRINFTMNPKSLISTNTLDLANFSLAQYVTINGTISKPNISVDPSGLIGGTGQAAMVANIAAGIAGGGIPAIAGLLAGSAATNKTTNNASPCKAALEN